MLAIPRGGRSARGWAALVNNGQVRALVYQVATAAFLVALIWWFASNAAANMAARGMSGGFDFLGVSAGFGISFTLIPYQEGDTYFRVFLVGITSENVEEMLKSEDPKVRRILGVEGNIGEGLGLENDFMVDVISTVGNYGEVYERNIGANTPIGLAREGTLNAQWTEGGILYAMPFR